MRFETRKKKGTTIFQAGKYVSSMYYSVISTVFFYVLTKLKELAISSGFSSKKLKFTVQINPSTAQKMKFSIKDFFSKCDQMSFLSDNLKSSSGICRSMIFGCYKILKVCLTILGRYSLMG